MRMRIKIKFEKPSKNNIVPSNNREIVTNYFHHVLGKDNEFHGDKSDYCISPICGGNLNSDKQTLSFPNSDPFIIVSGIGEDPIGRFFRNLMKTKPGLGYGMEYKCKNILAEEEENLRDGYNNFFTLSPIFLKEYNPNKRKEDFILIKERDDFTKKLEEKTKEKLKNIDPDLDLSDFKMEINEKHPAHKPKKAPYRGIGNMGSICKVDVHTNKKVAEILYHVGLGMSTGCGYGVIYTTQKKDWYMWNK